MDKCREEFEKIGWVKEILGSLHPTIIWFGKDNKYHTSFTGFDNAMDRLNGGWEIFQHQQAKVEELQTLYIQQGINMFKLQKRVAKLELILERIHRYGLDAYNVSTCMSIRDELEQALKGEG